MKLYVTITEFIKNQLDLLVVKNEKGSVLAEYGLLIVVIVIGAIAILYQLRDAIIGLFQKIIDGLGV